MNKKYQQFIDKKNKDWQYYSTISMKRIKKPITILLGPNGTGKSRSILDIDCDLQLNGINFIRYSTSRDDIVQKGAPAFGAWDPYKLAMAFSSEGERMTESFFDWMNTNMLCQVMTNDRPLWILVDEADSGLSIDRLAYTLSQFQLVVVSEVEKGRDIHAVLTCNSWEMLECFMSDAAKDYLDIIWVPTKESIHPRNYKAFKKLYMEYFNETFKKDLEGDKS